MAFRLKKRNNTAARALALLAGVAQAGCVSRAPVAPPDGSAFEAGLGSSESASAGLTVVPVRGAFPIDASWSLTAELEGPDGVRATHALPPLTPSANAGAQDPRPFLLALKPGRWTIASLLLKVEHGAAAGGAAHKGVIEAPLPVTLAGGPVAFDVRHGAFAYLGDLEIRFESAPPPVPDTNGARGVTPTARIVTRYVPTRFPSGAAWSPYLGGLSRLAIEGFAPGTAGAKPALAKAYVAFDSDSREPGAPLPGGSSGGIALVSDVPSVVVIETAPWRVERVASRPLDGTPHHVIVLSTQGKSKARMRGACAVTSATQTATQPASVEVTPSSTGAHPDAEDPRPAAPTAPTATSPSPAQTAPFEAASCRGDSDGSVPVENLEPLDGNVFRYVGHLEVDPARPRAMTLRHRLPDDARSRLSASLPVRSFVLGELVRDKEPGAWNLADAQGASVAGFAPEDLATGRMLEAAVGRCAAELWALDPLAPTSFELAIEPRADPSGGLEVSRDRTRGFAGPGLETTKRCLDDALARIPGFASPALSRGVRAHFR